MHRSLAPAFDDRPYAVHDTNEAHVSDRRAVAYKKRAVPNKKSKVIIGEPFAEYGPVCEAYCNRFF
jgi:hypothetical protein